MRKNLGNNHDRKLGAILTCTVLKGRGAFGRLRTGP